MPLCQELLPLLASQPIGKIHDPDTFKIRLGIPRSGNQHPGISVAYLYERGHLPLKVSGATMLSLTWMYVFSLPRMATKSISRSCIFPT